MPFVNPCFAFMYTPSSTSAVITPVQRPFIALRYWNTYRKRTGRAGFARLRRVATFSCEMDCIPAFMNSTPVYCLRNVSRLAMTPFSSHSSMTSAMLFPMPFTLFSPALARALPLVILKSSSLSALAAVKNALPLNVFSVRRNVPSSCRSETSRKGFAHSAFVQT